jgi:hypothetical protein
MQQKSPLTRIVPTFLGLSVVAAVVLSLTAAVPKLTINIRWKPDAAPSQRTRLERQWHLTEGRRIEGTTWQYELADYSSENIRSIVEDESVDDTYHLDRKRFQPIDAPTSRSQRVAGGALLFGVVGSGLLLILKRHVNARRLWTAFLVLSAAVIGIASLPSFRPTQSGADTTMLIALVSILIMSAVLTLEQRIYVSRRVLLVIVTVPPALFALGSGLVLVMALFGYEPFWQTGPDMSLVEAAFKGDRTAVSRMLYAGLDPNAPGRLRVGPTASIVSVTPLEAAVMSRDLRTVQVLLSNQAALDDSNRLRLTCLAVKVGAQSTAEYFRRSQKIGATEGECNGVALPVQ